MSSLSRRACYKCGNVGHYAGEWYTTYGQNPHPINASQRFVRHQSVSAITVNSLVWDQRSPQTTFVSSRNYLTHEGHESNGCPHPRTTETKQCYHCQGLGHVQADCPTLRLSGVGAGGRCYTCGQPGHLARSCPTAGLQPGPGLGRGAGMPRGGYGGGFRGGFAGGPRPATCYKCGGPNHYARDCQAQAMKCYACGKLGHISRDCTAPNGGPLNSAGKVCYKCGQAGHISRDCTAAETNGQVGVEAPIDPIAQVQPAAPTAAVA
ncbi:hypothetical protein MMC24_004974 [Lignoscripta atroalba]|nr:hypothetical protein [Lignoscripta atroalba]